MTLKAALIHRALSALNEIAPDVNCPPHVQQVKQELSAALNHSVAPLPLDDLPAEINDLLRRTVSPFLLGDSVRKRPGGGAWRGEVVGVYLASKTPLGFAVESVREEGSVQIYPAKALEEWDGQS